MAKDNIPRDHMVGDHLHLVDHHLVDHLSHLEDLHLHLGVCDHHLLMVVGKRVAVMMKVEVMTTVVISFSAIIIILNSNFVNNKAWFY